VLVPLRIIKETTPAKLVLVPLRIIKETTPAKLVLVHRIIKEGEPTYKIGGPEGFFIVSNDIAWVWVWFWLYSLVLFIN
jgi:hypothetical protein